MPKEKKFFINNKEVSREEFVNSLKYELSLESRHHSLLDKISEREFKQSIERYEDYMSKQDTLEARLGELLQFALYGNADDLSDFMRSRQKNSARLIREELFTRKDQIKLYFTEDEIRFLQNITNHFTSGNCLPKHWKIVKRLREVTINE